MLIGIVCLLKTVHQQVKSFILCFQNYIPNKFIMCDDIDQMEK